jgi:putative hydrolase of the HAD superfamily
MIRAVLLDWGDTLMRDLRRYEGPMAEWPEVEPVPGADEALAALAPRYTIAVASNTDFSNAPLVLAALARVGLDRYVDRVFASAAMGVAKPEAAFFERILADLEVEPGEAVMVGDRYDNDVAAAKAVGLWTLWLAPDDAPVPAPWGDAGVVPRHDARIATMRELPAAIARLDGR